MFPVEDCGECFVAVGLGPRPIGPECSPQLLGYGTFPEEVLLGFLGLAFAGWILARVVLFFTWVVSIQPTQYESVPEETVVWCDHSVVSPKVPPVFVLEGVSRGFVFVFLFVESCEEFS